MSGQRDRGAVTPTMLAAWEARRYDRLRRQRAAGALHAALPSNLLADVAATRAAQAAARRAGLLSGAKLSA